MIGLFFVFIDECFWQVKNSAVGIAYTLGEISWPLINALIEDITKNEIDIEKSKLDLLKMLAKDRNAYNLFDITIVLNEKIIGTYDAVVANNCNALEVGQKPPNELRTYDMSGNVWEWCHDWYGDYSSTKMTNPTGPAGPDNASHRVRRGGGWAQKAVFCRVASRFIGKPDGTGGIGLRITRTGD